MRILNTVKLPFFSRWQSFRDVIIICCFCCGLIGGVDSLYAHDNDMDHLNVVFDRSYFSSMNHRDALLAVKLWFEKFSETVDAEMEVEVTSFDNNEALVGLLERDMADVMILSSKGYFEVPANVRSKITPIFSTEIEDSSIQKCYHLLVKQSSDIQEWADLEGKKLLILNNYRCHLTEDWFKHSLKKIDVPWTSVRLEVADSVSETILPVFFGNADACIVGDEGFEMMKELNPQIGKMLKPVETSPKIVEVIICMRNGYTFNRELLIESILDFHNNPSGKQVMMLFQISRIVRFQENSLDPIESILQLPAEP